MQMGAYFPGSSWEPPHGYFHPQAPIGVLPLLPAQPHTSVRTHTHTHRHTQLHTHTEMQGRVHEHTGSAGAEEERTSASQVRPSC